MRLVLWGKGALSLNLYRHFLCLDQYCIYGEPLSSAEAFYISQASVLSFVLHDLSPHIELHEELREVVLENSKGI